MDGRLLVIEDDAQVRSMVARTLRHEGFDVTAVGDVSTALAALAGEAPDMVLLDLLLPDGDGVDVCRRLRSEGAAFPILMLTARDGLSDRIAGLDAGADDYVVKPFSTSELVARVRALLRRARSPHDLGERRFADVVVDLAAREASRAGRLLDLTPREFDLLAHLVANPRTVLSREELLMNAWDYEQAVATNAVDVYVGYLRKKLEARGGTRLIWTVRGAGYVLREGA